jgi:hypothetical protein
MPDSNLQLNLALPEKKETRKLADAARSFLHDRLRRYC